MAADEAPIGTILLVDDDKELREFLYQHLLINGHSVLQAGSGTEALERFEHNPDLDLLITDLVMPGLSGDQLALELLGRRPALPILFISGNASGQITSQVELREDDNFLRKPFSFEDFDHAVNRLLSGAEKSEGV